MANRWGNNGNSERLIFGAPKSLQMVIAAIKLKDTCSWKKSYDQPRQHIKKKIHYFADKNPSSQRCVFSSSHVWMWELDYKESWVWRMDGLKLWCWRRFFRVPWTARKSNHPFLKEISLNIHCKDWCWSWISNILTTWYEDLSHLKRPWWWERLMAGGEGDGRGWMNGWHHWQDGHEFE